MKYLILFISLVPFAAFALGREEMRRFSLLHDRLTIERSLIRDSYSQFFNLDIQASSGILDLIGDAKNGASSSAQTQTQKELNMYQLLSKYVNTEKFVDLNVIAGIPLPDIHYKGNQFLNSLFYEMNIGLSLSVNNQVSATNPVAQTYVRKETKTGIYTIWKGLGSTEHKLALYQLTRSDLASTIAYQTLATDGKFFNLDNLTDESKSMAFDWKWIKLNKKRRSELEVREVEFSKQNNIKTQYGSNPLFNAAQFWIYDFEKYQISPFLGFHFRGHYRVSRGFYGGVTYIGNERLPIKGTFKVDNQFFAIMPSLDLTYFRFSYAFKSPYRNPQDDYWVATLHQIEFGIPFP